MAAFRKFQIVNHASEALEKMNDLRMKRELCDVILCVENHEFQAHKIVLAGASAYLSAMFTNGMLESCKNRIELHGIEPEVMENLLDFIYTGSIQVDIYNVQSLLSAATMLNLQALRNSCCSFLESQLDASNCLGVRAFANLYSCCKLENTAYRYLCQHFLDVVNCEEFRELPSDSLIELLKDDLIQVRSEDQVFEAVEAWILQDYENRKNDIAQVLCYVRLPLLSLEYLETRVFPAPYIKHNTDCQMLLAKALNEHKDNLPRYLTYPRAQPQAVYVVGGRNSFDCQLSSLERYDIVSNEWTELENMKYPRTAVGACSLNEHLYVVGGECAVNTPHDDTRYLRCVECFNPHTGKWMTMCDIAIQRSFVSLAAVSGYIFALGGEDRSCSYNYVEKFCPKSNTWTPVQCMRRKRSGAGLAVHDGKIYVAGGYDRGVHSDRASVECYDPEIDTWTFVTELEKARSGLTLAVLNGYIYALGGRNRNTDHYFDLVERYNPQTHQWSAVAPMRTPRAWSAVAVFDGRIFVIGGFDGANRLNTIEVYDPNENTWRFVASMKTCRAGCGAAVL